MSHVYFASDFHLGVKTNYYTAKQREKIISNWIDSLPDDSQLFLLGDVFDSWYEYKEVIPRGYSHFFSALRKAVDRGVVIELFTGNHDMWMYDYFTKEYGIPVYHKPQLKIINGKRLFIGHGDGLGPDDISYKLTKKVLRNRVCQRLFKMLHPDFALKLMSKLSHTSRDTADEEPYLESEEWLVQYCKRKLETIDVDYFIFGHRHLVINYKLNEKSRYINLGEWINCFSFAKMDDNSLDIHFIDKKHKVYTE